jgi:peptidoglycan hydrolase CwlO-like protein
VSTARIYLQNEQFAIDRRNGIIIMALASQNEIIERFQGDYDSIEAMVNALIVRTAELDAQTAELDAQTAELDAQIARLRLLQ